MPFQITPLADTPFRHLYGLDDEALAAHGVRAFVVDERPGYPCRVSLEDAPLGARVLLLNHEHMDLPSPYRARHAIFVRDGAAPVTPPVGEVPAVIASRLIAARAYDADGMMTDAEIAEGVEIAPIIEGMFDDPKVAFIDLHNARRGCFAARVVRA